MQEDDRRPFALVHVVLPEAIALEEVGLPGPGALEGLVRGDAVAASQATTPLRL